jgi:hypothetical protein
MSPTSAEIAFRVTPTNAVVIVDGVLSRDRRIPRPPAGRIVTVVVHAESQEDTSVLVDYFTANPLTIALKPRVGLDEPIGVPAATVSSVAPKPHPKAKAKDPSVLPDNPY